MQNFMIRFSIKDSDGNNQYDYSDDFVVSLDYTIDEKKGSAKIQKELYTLFKEKIKAAVIEWYGKDAELVKDEIAQYGYMRTVEPDPDDSDEETKKKELQWVLDTFPARCVSHIPDDIMANHGFSNAPDMHCEIDFYDDGGFINDEE